MTGACDPHPVKVDGDVRALRVDPAMDCCAVKDQEALMEWGKEMGNSKRLLSTNGKNRKGELCICHQGSQPLV